MMVARGIVGCALECEFAAHGRLPAQAPPLSPRITP